MHLLPSCEVATAPTVYGIETFNQFEKGNREIKVATAPTVYGIETSSFIVTMFNSLEIVATAPTVYGIETGALFSTINCLAGCNSTYRLRY